jgi:DNA-binding SARP family transcriptional activator
MVHTRQKLAPQHRLFFYLLTRPEGLSKEMIGAIFWPDYSPAKLKTQFKSTIYRLRRAVGSEVIVHTPDTDRYSFNRTLDYEYDVELFQEKLGQAQTATSRDEQIALYQTAVDVYQGRYLPEIEGTWVWIERERLWQAYEEAVLHLATLYLKSEAYEQTLLQCRQLLTYDLCLESAHCLAMQAYAKLGNRTAVKRQFEQCQQALQTKLEVAPTPQTVALYQALIGASSN